MAKLYVQAQSDKGGRHGTKTGEYKMFTQFFEGNTETLRVYVQRDDTGQTNYQVQTCLFGRWSTVYETNTFENVPNA